VDVELQEQLLTRERELDSREGAVAVWEEGMVAFARVLEEVHTKRDASHVRADAVRRDFFSRARASSFQSKQLTNLGRALEE
jgi:hypothetical protein